ncbi:hypothetical protein AAHA92_32739 [Salvia divinorum]|uniref:Uncharacterized protein n=1 Tax=Salvia divinorum TaxID=28513 RepID=A0ABD1FLQ5_SALDI
MVKIWTAIIAAALFCLFTISLARASAQVALPLRDADPALRLPSEPINTQAAAKTNTEIDPNFADVSAVPMTKITFRPVNRHFLKRPCRHHFKFYPTMRDNQQIPYGNDMLIASGENSDFKQHVGHGGGKRIPGRWMRMHHHHLRYRRGEDSDSDNEEEDDRVKKVMFKRYDYNRFDREKKLKKLRQRFRIGNEKKEAKSKTASFFKGVRKFLNNYF